MKRRTQTLPWILAVGLAASGAWVSSGPGCTGKSKEKGGKAARTARTESRAGGGQQAGRGAARPGAPEARKAAQVVLETVKDAGYGYEIQIPKGSKVLQKDEFGHTYSYVLPGGMMEFNVHLMKTGVKDLQSLVNHATMMGPKKIEEKKAIADGFLVVKAPQGILQEVWVSKKGKTASVTAKCSGPAKQKDMLLKICTSLKVTK